MRDVDLLRLEMDVLWLGLRPLGWIWQVHPIAEPAASDQEPSSPTG